MSPRARPTGTSRVHASDLNGQSCARAWAAIRQNGPRMHGGLWSRRLRFVTRNAAPWSIAYAGFGAMALISWRRGVCLASGGRVPGACSRTLLRSAGVVPAGHRVRQAWHRPLRPRRARPHSRGERRGPPGSMDAAGSERADVAGFSESGAMATSAPARASWTHDLLQSQPAQTNGPFSVAFPFTKVTTYSPSEQASAGMDALRPFLPPVRTRTRPGEYAAAQAGGSIGAASVILTSTSGESSSRHDGRGGSSGCT